MVMTSVRYTAIGFAGSGSQSARAVRADLPPLKRTLGAGKRVIVGLFDVSGQDMLARASDSAASSTSTPPFRSAKMLPGRTIFVSEFAASSAVANSAN